MSKDEQIQFKVLSKTTKQQKVTKTNNYNFTGIVKNNPLQLVYTDMSKVQKDRVIEREKK